MTVSVDVETTLHRQQSCIVKVEILALQEPQLYPDCNLYG